MSPFWGLLPSAEELDAMLATAKACNGFCHATEPPKKVWTPRKAKVPELLPADSHAEKF